jgi:hypothetical protein
LQQVNLLKSLNFCKIQPNPNYPGQYRILMKYKFQEIGEYPLIVVIKPFEDKNEIVVKTAYPDRKLKDLISNC